MHPIWRDIRQRHQHKGTFMHPRVRQDHLFGGNDRLLLKRQIHPMTHDINIRAHQITGSQKIEVNRPLLPARASAAPQIRLHGMQLRQGLLRTPVSRDGQRFLMVQPVKSPTPTQVKVVLNWFQELKQLAPTN